MDIIWCWSDLPGVRPGLIYGVEKQSKNGGPGAFCDLGTII